MALVFPSPSEIADQYLTILKNIRPEVDIKKTDSDWWIRSRVVGGVVSGLYADQSKIADDAFPQSARSSALSKHLFLYFNRDFNPAQPADGPVLVRGVVGSVIPAGTELVYGPTGNVYQTIDAVTLTDVTGIVQVQSVLDGQSQNLISGAEFTFSNTPAGLEPTAVASDNIADGRDVESKDEAAAAILNRIQQPPAGGTANDYQTFAKSADASVVNASVVRFLFGLGTVGIVITAGTTDVDAALNSGAPVVREPSQALIDQVQAFVEAKQVLTDCVHVMGPNTVTIDVDVRVRFSDGNEDTLDASSGLSYGDLVRREVKRAIYKTPPGGRRFGNQGFLLASEIEEVIDLGLSNTSYDTGVYAQILSDRQVMDLSLTGVNRLIDSREIIEPGTINILSF